MEIREMKVWLKRMRLKGIEDEEKERDKQTAG
jgi:hypothetical protein